MKGRDDMPNTPTERRNCYCGPGAIRHDHGDGQHCKGKAGSLQFLNAWSRAGQESPTATGQPPHKLHDDVFEDAHVAAAGAIMGARMAGKDIAPWTADMNEAFRAAVAEAFDVGFHLGQEAAR